MGGTERVTPRREFMRNVGIGAAAMAVSAVGLRADAQPVPDYNPAYIPYDNPEDEAWLKRLTGRHRQVFDAVSPNEGWALIFAANFIKLNMQAYGLKQSDVTAVVGLRHMAAPLALNDAMWAKYKIGEMLKIEDKSTHAPATRNVFSSVQAGDMPMAGAGVDELLARGAIVTVCNLAITVLSGMAATAAGLPPENAKAEWKANLIPGVVVVPAGVLAVNRAQENRCTYCYGG